MEIFIKGMSIGGIIKCIKLMLIMVMVVLTFLTIGFVGVFDAPVVSDVFALGVDPVQVDSNLAVGEVAVLEANVLAPIYQSRPHAVKHEAE